MMIIKAMTPGPMTMNGSLNGDGSEIRSLYYDRISSTPAPTLRIRVKYGALMHEIHINSQATFGELKKFLDSNAYLNVAAVKDKSKIVLIEYPTNQKRRYIEMRKNAKVERDKFAFFKSEKDNGRGGNGAGMGRVWLDPGFRFWTRT
ncbi:hypothetical protein AMTRI_Chr03g139590 [Amborella trichopoda]